MCDDVKDWKLGKAVCCVRKRQTARQCISEIQSLISGCCSCHFETWTSAPLCLAVCRTKPLAIDLGNFCICSLFAQTFYIPQLCGVRSGQWPPVNCCQRAMIFYLDWKSKAPTSPQSPRLSWGPRIWLSPWLASWLASQPRLVQIRSTS